MKKLFLGYLIIFILITLLFNGCLDTFNPFCSIPDASKITANREQLEPRNGNYL